MDSLCLDTGTYRWVDRYRDSFIPIHRTHSTSSIGESSNSSGLVPDYDCRVDRDSFERVNRDRDLNDRGLNRDRDSIDRGLNRDRDSIDRGVNRDRDSNDRGINRDVVINKINADINFRWKQLHQLGAGAFGTVSLLRFSSSSYFDKAW